MELKQRIILKNLSKDSVNVRKETYVVFNGSETVLESNETRYDNSPRGREELLQAITDEYQAATLSIWGSEPTIQAEEPSLEFQQPQPNQQA